MPGATPREQLIALADRCVQCGLCLPSCPTYSLERMEPQSPRGRIALARGWALDLIEPTPAGDDHLDDCLACRSCEAVCPAGVQYGELLLTARGMQRDRRAAGWRQRLLEWLAARPRYMTALLGAYRRLRPALPRACQPLPAPPTMRVEEAPASDFPERVLLFTGCVARTYEPPVRAALAHLLGAMGIGVDVPPDQTCCGALHAHAGNLQSANSLAVRNRGAFAAGAEAASGHPTEALPVLTLATGCHESVAKAAPGRTIDALDFLDRHADRLTFAATPERVALHLPCTQRNVVGSVPALRRLLARVPGLEVVELDAGHGCCGAAGSNMLLDPTRADAFRQPLLAQLQASGARRVLSANIGCRLHLANGTRIAVQHPLELLAEVLSQP